MPSSYMTNQFIMQEEVTENHRRNMSTDEVVVLDCWVSPFAMRVKIALAEKGIEFVSRKEDLPRSKSDLLLKSNPIYKKVPVLLHNGKAICESAIIVSYIDEAWPSPSLFPAGPYERAQSRFWADFVDKKVFEGGSKIWQSKGEAIKGAVEEFIGILKVLEGVLGGNDFLGGDSFGFTDIIAIPLTSWFYAYEQYGGFKLEDECPKFTAWMKRCMQKETVAKVLPDPVRVYEFVGMLRTMHGIE